MHDDLLDLSILLLTPTSSAPSRPAQVGIPPDILPYLTVGLFYVGPGPGNHVAEEYRAFTFIFSSMESRFIGGAWGNGTKERYALLKTAPADLRAHFGRQALTYGFPFPPPPLNIKTDPNYAYVGMGGAKRAVPLRLEVEKAHLCANISSQNHQTIDYAGGYNLSSDTLHYQLHQNASYEMFKHCFDTLPV